MLNDTLALAQMLIARRSPTPFDNGCQEILIDRLEKMGFDIERIRCGEVDNLWARRGTEAPLICFAGHTDVVPTAPLEKWESDPFDPVTRNGRLYGRGGRRHEGIDSGIHHLDRGFRGGTSRSQWLDCAPDHVG